MTTLPKDFVRFWRLLVHEYDGPVRAHRVLLGSHAQGQPIPGYPNLKATDSLPAGWDFGNLVELAPTPEERRLRQEIVSS